MKVFDLLSEKGTPAGMRKTSRGIEVTRPWGAYTFPSVYLDDGWYELVSDAPASLELYDLNAFQLIELQAGKGASAVVKLSRGTYRLALRIACRPGHYAVISTTFSRFPITRRYSLFTGRLLQAVKSGMSLRRIWTLGRKTMSRGQTFGVRSSKCLATGDLGVLALSDDPARIVGVADAGKRIGRLERPPKFLLTTPDYDQPPKEVYEGQLYPHFTADPLVGHDYVVTVAATDRLTPDALLLFAEHIIAHPEAAIVLADKWVEGRPTAHIAWDPLLYADRLPTPYAIRPGRSPCAHFGDESEFSIVGVPVATGQEEVFVEYGGGASEQRPCSIIIPTRDRADLMASCLEGLFEGTTWPHEVIVIDNGSVEPRTFAIFERYQAKGLKVIRADMPFNFSRLCNIGAGEAKFPYLVFLNNDVVLHRSDWLSQLMRFAQLPDVGAVGARLLYADGRLQHGGVMLGLTQLCGHLWRGLTRDLQDTETRLRYSSLRSAVTGACLCVAKEKFYSVGGFDDALFPVTLNDIDLCLKLDLQGWRSVYAAKAEAYHLEGESRGEDIDPSKAGRRLKELKAFTTKWKSACEADAFLSEAILRSSEQCRWR